VNINAGLPGVCGLNNGNGSVAWGDYDNDGRLDILLTGFSASGSIAQVWRNTRTGFVNSYVVLPGLYDGSAAWGDYDNDGRLDILLTGYSALGPIAQVWRNYIPTSNSPPSAPSDLAVNAARSALLFSWNTSTDNETPSTGLTYNVRVGTTPGGSDVLSPRSADNGFRRVPQLGGAQERLFARLEHAVAGTTYYWSVQAVDSTFAGSPFAPEKTFKLLPVVVPVTTTTLVPGDINSDGIVDQNELNTVLSNYWPNSGWLQMTNPMKFNDGYFQFALTNSTTWNLSVLVSSNLVDWDFLGPAFPVYEFYDPQGTNSPDRFYRLRWP